MKAMILAAGLGTRLRPLTDSMPKALVEIDKVPMLERVILNLKKMGAKKIIVNVHHFGEMIIDFLNRKDYGLNIEISDERGLLLDTGGGIVKAAPLIFKEDNAPVLIHNVDILSNADLNSFYKNDGTRLLVSDRESTRKLVFDNNFELKGWHDIKNNIYRPEYLNKMQSEECKGIRNVSGIKELAFSGIYMLTEASVNEMKLLFGHEKFPIMDYFLHPCRKEKIMGEEMKGLKVIDIGKPATLSQANEIFRVKSY